VSTQDLAQVIMKATGAANTFGVSLESMLGHATAIIEVTRESGSVVGNSLKTIYSRITTMDDSIAMLESVGVAVRDMNGQLRPVEQILNDLAKRWSSLNSEQQQMLGLQLAGRYQLSRFLVLMQQYNQALKAQRTAINSNGSAYRENERYLDSYQARLNRLSNAWTETTLAMQRAFLGTGIVAFAELMTAVTKSATSFIDTFGLLPPVLGAVTAGFLLFNNQLRTATMTNGILMINTLKGLATGFRTLDGAVAATTLRMRMMDAVSKTTTMAITGLRTALVSAGTFLAGAVLPTAAFMALGWAIGKVTEKIVEYNEHQKRIKQESQQLASTYASNEEKIQSLADKYEKLSNEVNKGLRPENDKEYLQVQQELYNLLPTLAERVDSKGQAHLRSAEAVRQEIESIKELAKLESQNFVDNFDKKVDKVKNNIEDLQRQINNIKNPPMTAVDWKAGIPNELTTEDKIDIAIKQREINAQIEQAIGLYKQYADAYADTLGVKKQLNDADTKYINKLIEQHKATLLTKEGQKDLTREIQNYIGKASEVRKVTGDLFSGKQIQKFKEDQINTLESVANAVKHGNTNWDEHKRKLTDAGFSASDASRAIKYLSGSLDENKNAVKSNVISLDELDDKLKEAKGDFNALADIVIQLARQGNYNEAMTVAMSDAYQTLADEVAPLNELLEKLAEGKQISAAEAMELIAKEHELANAISIENGVVKVNREAVFKLRDAKVASYSDMLKSIQAEAKANANATLSKLRNYGIEIQAIQNLQDAKRRLAELDELRNIANSGMGSWDTRDQINEAYNQVKDVIDLYENIQNLTNLVTSGLNQIGTSYENISDAQDKSNKKTEEAIYVADKYKRKLEEINLELEKQRALQEKYTNKNSRQYMQALKKEIDLLNKKKKILQEQQKDLENQIRTGKVRETGIVTLDTGSSSSFSSSRATGNDRASTIWNFFASKGFSDSVIAGILGNLRLESGLNPEAKNPSSGASGIAQWLGSRLTGLKRYAGSMGKSWKSLDVQLNYLWKELNTTEKRTLNWLLNNQNASPETVAVMFEKLFERSGGAALAQRRKYAIEYYNQYANGNRGSSSSSRSRKKAEQQQAIDNAKSQLIDIKNEIIQIDQEIAQKRQELVDHLSEQVINAYKEAYEKQKEIALDALEKEQEAFEKAHEEKMKKLDEELEKYEEVINQQLEAIDKQQDEEDYNKRLAKEQQKRQEILDELNKLALDDSISAKKRKEELTKQLQEQDEIIAEMQNERSVQLRKDNLQQQLEEKRKSIEDQKEKENEEYEKKQDEFEKRREEIEKQYENLINDERKFAKIRSDIQKGNLTTILKELDGFYKKIKSNTSLFGTSITNNFLDMINNIKDGLKNYKDIFIGGGNNNNRGNNNNNRGNNNNGNRNRNKNNNNNNKDKNNRDSRNKSSSKRKTTVALNMRKSPSYGNNVIMVIPEDAVVDYLGMEKGWAKVRYKGKVGYVGSKYLKKFDTGGYTGDNVPKEGALAILHKKELVLNKTDTSKILETVKIARDIFKTIKLPKIKLSKIELPPLKLPSPALAGNTYNINLYINKLNGDKKSAEFLLSEVVKGVKTRGGDI
jgi:hypothetical protein